MAARKIAARQASLPGSGSGLAELIVVDNTAWLAPDSHAGSVADLALDLRARHRLRIRYRRSGANQPTSQVVDPYGLAAKSGRWYLVADHNLQGRLFNLDRLESYEVLPGEARTRAGHELRSVWNDLKHQVEAPGQVTMTVRLRESRVDLARRILGAHLGDVGPADMGWCLATVRYPEIESVRQLLQFGDHIEVLAPAQARQRVYELATDLAQRHTAATS
jgi:predicted DNA-binding transcriptional regulator YafY